VELARAPGRPLTATVLAVVIPAVPSMITPTDVERMSETEMVVD
jgi:hypothetical protein